MFQIKEKNGCYIVEVYIRDVDSLRGHWHPLRNFGERQGDAIMFKEYDCPKLEIREIQVLINRYDESRKFIRRSSHQFIVER